MNEPAAMNNPSFPTRTNPVFSPAVRFAPKEISVPQAIRRIAYWAAIIAVVLVMGRSGFSYVREVWSERPRYHSTK
jgi:hypothetical protein